MVRSLVPRLSMVDAKTRDLKMRLSSHAAFVSTAQDSLSFLIASLLRMAILFTNPS